MAAGALSIKLRCASWQQLATIYKRDLSKGTMFLKASTPPPLGTAVRIDLTLPSGSVVVLAGAVDQHVDDPQRGAGVELKLGQIDERTTWMIENALAAESKTRTATPASGIPIVKPRAPTAPPVEMSVSEGQEVSAAEQELVRALVSEAESLKKLNPFLVLGVGYEATDDDVRAAFGELTKRYHPDRFARYQSTDLRTTAAEIFILIRDAYRKLGDEAGRTQTLASLGRSPAPRAVAAPRPATPPPPLPPRMTQRVPTVATPPGGVPIVTPASGGPPPPPVAVIGAAPRAIVDQKSAPVRAVPTTPGAGRAVEAAPRAAIDHKSGPIRAVVERSMPSPVVDQKSGPVRAVVDHKSGPIRSPAAPTTPMPQASRGTGPNPIVLPPNAKAGSGPVQPLPRAGTRPPPVPKHDSPTSHGNVDTAGGTVDIAAPTEAPERASSPQKVIGPITDAADAGQIEDLLDLGRVEEAMNAYRLLAKKYPNDRNFRAGIELCEGLNALTARDRLEAAQRFEAALEIDPSNERAARELADMRRQATNERKGLLSRLMGKKEP